MSRSGQSSRSTSSYSSDSKQRDTYDPARYNDRYLEPRYATTLNDPRSGSSSKSSSSKSGRSSNSDKIPPSISRGSSSRDDGRSKTTDGRYYPESFLNSRQPQKKPLSSQTKERDERYYSNSSYY